MRTGRTSRAQGFGQRPRQPNVPPGDGTLRLESDLGPPALDDYVGLNEMRRLVSGGKVTANYQVCVTASAAMSDNVNPQNAHRDGLPLLNREPAVVLTAASQVIILQAR